MDQRRQVLALVKRVSEIESDDKLAALLRLDVVEPTIEELIESARALLANELHREAESIARLGRIAADLLKLPAAVMEFRTLIALTKLQSAATDEHVAACEVLLKEMRTQSVPDEWYSYANLTSALAIALSKRGEAERAHAHLDRAVRRYRDDTTVVASLRLTSMTIAMDADDLADALRCAESALAEGALASFDEGSTVLDGFRQPLMVLADRLYFERQAYAEAAKAFDLVATAFGDEATNLNLLGTALLRIERYDEAAVALGKVIATGSATAATYMNLANAQASADVHAAIDTIGIGIHLDDRDPRIFAQRAHYWTMLGEDQCAVEDLTRAIEIAGSKHIDVQQKARIARAQILLARGEHAAAERDLDAAAAGPNHDHRHLALFTHANMEIERGDTIAGIRSLDRILAGPSYYADVLECRARAFIEAGQYEAAGRDISVLSARDGHPEAAVRLLGRLISIEPDEPRWYAMRGVALYHMSFPKHAVDDLTVAIERGIPDLELRTHRGLCLLMATGFRSAMAPPPENTVLAWRAAYTNPWSSDAWLDEEREWNASLNGLRTVGALADFAFVCQAAEGEAKERASELFRRTLDHVIGHQFFARLLDSEMVRLLLPNVSAAGSVAADAYRAVARRDFHEAAQLLHRAKSLYRECGLPREALRIDIKLADVELRLHRVQSAIDRAEAAARGLRAYMTPLTQLLAPTVEEAAEAASERGQPMIALEFEYIQFLALGGLEQDLMVKMLRVDGFTRLGAMDRAVDEMGNREELELKIVDNIGDQTGLLMLRTIAQTLRDADRLGEAKSLLERHRARAHDPQTLFAYDWTMVTVLSALQEVGPAKDLADQLVRNAAAQGTGVLAELNIERASLVLQSGDFEGALQTLVPVGPYEPQLRDEQRFGYWRIRAYVLLALSRYDESLAAFDAAISQLEKMRAGIAASSLRADFLGSKSDVFGEAICAAIGAEDVAKVFELAERGRARTLLDDLELGVPDFAAIDPVKAALVDRLRRREQRMSALLDLFAQRADRVEIVRRYRELASNSEEAPSVEKLIDELQTLRRTIGEHEDDLLRTRHDRNSELGRWLTIQRARELLSPPTFSVGRE